MKKMIMAVLALALIAGLVPTAHADEKTSVTAKVNPGNLTLTAPGSVAMTAVNLDALPDQGGASTGSMTLGIRNHRPPATNTGWSLTAVVSNFVSGTDVIPVDRLTVTPGDLTPIANSPLTGTTTGPEVNPATPTTPISLAQAASGNGRGRYTQEVGLSLAIDVATAPGDYSATIVETLI